VNTTSAISPATPWCGWHRRNRKSLWKRLVTGEDEAEAFRLLLEAVAGRHGDLMVCPEGKNPNDHERGQS
jgi:hypothetical protein